MLNGIDIYNQFQLVWSFAVKYNTAISGSGTDNCIDYDTHHPCDTCNNTDL